MKRTEADEVLPEDAAWIDTYTGRHFNPLLPDPVRVLLREVPDDLGTTTDRVGHVRTAYSSVVGAADDVVVTYPRAAVAGHGNVAMSRFLHGFPRGAGQRVASRTSTMRARFTEPRLHAS